MVWTQARRGIAIQRVPADRANPMATGRQAHVDQVVPVARGQVVDHALAVRAPAVHVLMATAPQAATRVIAVRVAKAATGQARVKVVRHVQHVRMDIPATHRISRQTMPIQVVSTHTLNVRAAIAPPALRARALVPLAHVGQNLAVHADQSPAARAVAGATLAAIAEAADKGAIGALVISAGFVQRMQRCGLLVALTACAR